MFPMIDWPLVAAGLLLGVVLGTVIILFLIYAAVQAARIEDKSSMPGTIRWSPTSKYETQRSHLHALGHDPEAIEW
jgi:hypothetical protein